MLTHRSVAFRHTVRRFGIIVALIVSTIIPSAAYAQSADDLRIRLNELLSQLARIQEMHATLSAAAPASSDTCPSLPRTLKRGMEGADVRALQTILTSTGDYAYGEVTGYFGPATEKAVRAYQIRNGIVNSGDASSTGFGAVGPATRASIARSCMSDVQAAETSSSQAAPDEASQEAATPVMTNSVPQYAPVPTPQSATDYAVTDDEEYENSDYVDYVEDEFTWYDEF